MGLQEISNILWRERQLLELLLFKLEEEQLLLAAGRTRFLAHATREVEAVLDELKQAELVRAAAVDAVAAELGLPANPSLRELAAAAPAPWGSILGEHRDAFLAATQEITAVAEANRQLLGNGQQAVREAMRWVDVPDDTYGPGRSAPAPARTALLVDEEL